MPDSEIQPIPLPVPKEIIEAVNNGKLAIFIGAGVSRLVGCKGWDELGRRLLERCFTTQSSDGSTLISYKVREKLATISDNKKLITICHYILKTAHLEDAFFDEMREALKPREDLLKAGNIYDELIGLPALYVTTNADTIFDSKFNEESIKFRIIDCDASALKPTRLYHIHGSINYSDTMVFTVDQYIQRYRNEQFGGFLRKIFAEYCVLFVGYGLAEFELLDFIVPRMDPSQSKEAKYFMLLGLYRGEDTILEYERYYYNQMGISVHAYQMDEKGYFQLYEVVKRWNQEIHKISKYLYDTFDMLEEAANNFNSAQLDRVLQTIRNDSPQREHFFKTLASTSEPGPWLGPLIQQGYFDPSNNPQPESLPGQENLFRIPQWSVLGFLENASARDREKPNDETTKLILEIITPLIAPGSDTKPRVDNYRTDWFLVKVISNLPPGQIAAEHIGFIALALRTKWDPILILGEISKPLLPRLIQEGAVDLVLLIIKELFQWRTEIGDESSNRSTSNDYWLNEILQVNKVGIIRLCSIEASKLALDEIQTICQKDPNHFGEFEIPSLTVGDEGGQGGIGQDSYQTQLVLFARDMLEGSNPDLIRDLIQELLGRDHPIFRRIALHTISHNYAKLGDLFWHWKENPLEDDFVRYELYSLLSDNSSSLSKDQIGQVLEWLEKKSYFIPVHLKNDNSAKEQLIAYWKKYWVYTLLKTEDPRVVSAFEKYNKVNPEEIQFPRRSWRLQAVPPTPSPIEKADLLAKSNAEIEKYIEEFLRTKKRAFLDDEGLLECFRSAVKENPSKFITDMTAFMNLPDSFQAALITSISEAWQARKDFPWDELLAYLLTLVEPGSFWEEDKLKSHLDGHREWVVGSIADLIREGCEDDKHAFDQNLIPVAEKVLLILMNRSPWTTSDVKTLVITFASSTKEKVFYALITISLRRARLSKTASAPKWSNEVKEAFTKRLDRTIEPSLDFSVSLGKYLPQLHYLDKDWVKEKLDQIFPGSDEVHWKAAMTGYLHSPTQNIYQSVYILLRENGLYTKAIGTKFEYDRAEELLAQHICVGYLEDLEKLDDPNSLVSLLIDAKNVNQIEAVVRFFHFSDDSTTKPAESKIRPLWKALIQALSDSISNPQYGRIVAQLGNWLPLITQIDDEALSWLKLSARAMSAEPANNYLFIPHLSKRSKDSPAQVAGILLEMLGADVYPDFKQEEIIGIVEDLYLLGQKENADKICNMYGAKGYDFLKETFRKHNKPEASESVT